MTNTLELKEEDLSSIKLMIDQGQFQAAEKTLDAYLTDNPGSPHAFFLMGRIYIATGRAATARLIYSWLHDFDPKWQVKVNLGKCYDLLLAYKDSEQLYREVMDDESLSDQVRMMGWAGYTTTLVQQYRTEEALKECEAFLRKYPDSKQVKINYGFALLQNREFGRGWEFYEEGIGELKWRDARSYAGEPLWDGRMGKEVNLLVYAEQGLGDQIVGVEPLRDAMKAVNVVGLSCDKGLYGLYKRSFPDTHVFYRDEDAPKVDIDFSCPVFSLHKHFRKSEGDYPQTPFLTPDPMRSAQWKDSFLSWFGRDKRVIGLIWSGGTSITGKAARRGNLMEWGPIFEKLGGAEFVSLEYRDREKEITEFNEQNPWGVKVHSYPWASMSRDFDDAMALISAMDMVVGVPSTAVHAAGSLGIPGYLMVHGSPNVHYHARGDKMAYYKDVKMVRRPLGEEQNWGPSCEKIADLVINDWVSL